MKLTFDMHGYTITIEEIEDMVTVTATKDDEVIEEFELEVGEAGEMDDMEDDMDDMEDDMGGQSAQELPEGEEEEDFEETIGESKLQNFSSFLKNK